ncbi:MAG: zinc-ribbon domain containing protein [Eubacteriales bacterium]|nr:zinc-ribbon domain containing protein [Eubacteriales bacterium]
MYQDKTIACKDCGKDFIFTAGEQEFYAEKGFENEPTRCKECRMAKKDSLRNKRQMHTAVCAGCGGEAVVPFEPKGDKPVYCSNCFSKMNEQA